jgi:hypothetical protein
MSLSSLSTLLLGTSSRAKQRFPLDTTRLQVKMSNLTLKRRWKKADELSMGLRATVLSELDLLGDQYRRCVREKQSRNEEYDQDIKLRNEMLRDEKLMADFEEADLLQEFKRAMENRKSYCENPHELPIFKIISQRSAYVVATGYTGFWGGFHSMFNQHLARSVPQSLSLSEIQKIAKRLKTEQSSVSKSLSKLYSTVRKGKRDLMLSTSQDVLRSQELNILLLSSTCSLICASTSAALEGRIDGDAKKLGNLDLLAGKLIRSSILLVVWALYVAYIALLPDGDPKFQKIVKTSRELPFSSKRKKAKVVSPKSLSVNGQNFDGKYVKINGFVKNMTTARTQDGKFLNLFEVYVPGSEEQAVRVAVIFEHMGHRGLVNSSYVELFGTWKETSPLADTPVLQLERLKISDLSKRFGFDYILESIRPWFDYFPNSYHAYWSVRPQKKIGSTGQRRTLTGAGEIIAIRPFSSGLIED